MVAEDYRYRHRYEDDDDFQTKTTRTHTPAMAQTVWTSGSSAIIVVKDGCDKNPGGVTGRRMYQRVLLFFEG